MWLIRPWPLWIVLAASSQLSILLAVHWIHLPSLAHYDNLFPDQRIRGSEFSLAETLENHLVRVLDNNIELAQRIVLSLDAFRDSSKSRALARAYLSAPYPRVTSGPIWLDDRANSVARTNFRSQLPITRSPDSWHHEHYSINAVLTAYLEDLGDIFRYFVVPPSGASAATAAAAAAKPACVQTSSQVSCLNCSLTSCQPCPVCSPDYGNGSSQYVHLESSGQTFTGTPAPPVDEPQVNWGATNEWLRLIEDLYPHKSGLYGEREDLLVKYLASHSQSERPKSNQLNYEAYEQWMRVLASLGEPLTSEIYLAARTSAPSMDDGQIVPMDARTIQVKLFAHLTRLTRRLYLGTEDTVERKCRQTNTKQCARGSVLCDSWPCRRLTKDVGPLSVVADDSALISDLPESELKQGSGDGTCGWAPLNRGKSFETLRFSEAPFHRIINGQPQEYGEFPSYVFLVINQQLSCGGTLISDRHILTAGHCVSFGKFSITGAGPAPSASIRVTMGEHLKWKRDKYEYAAGVRRVCRAPNYWSNGGEALHDWAILELAEPARFNQYVQPACLPRDQLAPPTKGAGANCWLAGFGLVGFQNGIVSDTTGISPNVLQKIRLEQASCRPWNIQPLDKSRVCYGRPKMQRGGSCRGDSGGPVLCQDRKTQRWFVMALVSYGTSSCDIQPTTPVHANVYADVQRLLPDIEKCIKG